MIEPGFLQVQVKGVFSHPLELYQPNLRHAPKAFPEAFNAIDMDAAPCKFIPRMINTIVTIAQIDQATIAGPAGRLS